MSEQQPKKELFQIGGDPTLNSFSPDSGAMSGMNFVKTSEGRPWVKVLGVNDLWLEVDYYKLIGNPGYLHLICPKCGNSLKIQEDRKQISYEPARPLHKDLQSELEGIAKGQLDARMAEGFSRFGGTLNVEPFECTWEEDGTLKRGFGLGRCSWRAAIVNNVARNMK